MTTKSGHTQHDRQGIADVFADFYETLFTQTDACKDTPGPTDHDKLQPIAPFTIEELEVAMKGLKNGRSKDTSGILAEMLKDGGPTLWQTLPNLYNEVLKPDKAAPTQWRRTQFTVLHKSGDARLPHNYRPIAAIPLLYKLFSRLLYNRLETTLDAQQPPDQAGFRRHYSTEDHLFTFSLLQETCNEWQLPLWIATVDFKKAFDTASHSALWAALLEQGISTNYVHLLTRLYADQTGVIRTEFEPRIQHPTRN